MIVSSKVFPTVFVFDSLNVFFHRKSSASVRHLPLKVILHEGLSSIDGCLPFKVVFHSRSSFIEGCLPLEIVLSWVLPLMVIFIWRSSSIDAHLARRVILHQWWPKKNLPLKLGKNITRSCHYITSPGWCAGCVGDWWMGVKGIIKAIAVKYAELMFDWLGLRLVIWHKQEQID